MKRKSNMTIVDDGKERRDLKQRGRGVMTEVSRGRDSRTQRNSHDCHFIRLGANKQRSQFTMTIMNILSAFW